jgi:ferredoxin-thioredoxin reductase catalytic subunit
MKSKRAKHGQSRFDKAHASKIRCSIDVFDQDLTDEKYCFCMGYNSILLKDVQTRFKALVH